jgi:predicted protein tyrosine phosphatase
MNAAKIDIGASYSRGNNVHIQQTTMDAMKAPVKLHSGPSHQTIDRYARVGRNNMDRVDQNVFIGNSSAASNLEELRGAGITKIVNCAKELPNYHDQTGMFSYLRLELEDGVDDSTHNDLYRVVEPVYRYIRSMVKQNPNIKILVHCKAGISRSASIVIYYLMRKNKMTYDKAFEYLKTVRDVNPNGWYQQQLRGMDIELQALEA